MSDIVTERVCAEPEREIVVFLIGVRLNKLWKVWKWFPVLSAMPRMLEELGKYPELGMLHARSHLGVRNSMVVQYWKSAEHLQNYAQAAKHAHLPAWQAFNRVVGTSGDVGIWHETYVVPADRLESIYVNMPRYGLGLAGEVFPATAQRSSAAKRMARVATAEPSMPA